MSFTRCTCFVCSLFSTTVHYHKEVGDDECEKK